jgi:DnaJ domain
VTLYDILEVMPGASAQEIQRAYEARMRQLAPDVISGASSKVLAAVDRARAAADHAWRVLGDPAARARYDRQAGLRPAGGGLTSWAAAPSEPEFVAIPFVDIEDPQAVAEGALDALVGWLAPSRGPSRRVVAPDVRGLFARPCMRAVGAAGLRLEPVVLTANPMPVEGLIVDQSPAPGRKMRRSAALTVYVWHPATRPTARL